MSISGFEIRKRTGIIVPYFPKKMISNGCSYGESFSGYDIRLGCDAFLQMGFTTLAVSEEYFSMPLDLDAEVKDKSSLVRMGIKVQNTDIEPGWRGYLTLELTYEPVLYLGDQHLLKSVNEKQLLLPKGHPIAKIKFSLIDGELDMQGYTGKYQDQPQVPVEFVMDNSK